MASDRGAALIDVLAATGLCVVMATIAVPVAGRSLDRDRVRVGAQLVAASAQRARLEAFKRGMTVAMRVEVLDGGAAVQLFRDGNGNGVLQRDIDRGVDLPLAPATRVSVHARDVSWRINQVVTDVSGAGELAAGADPVRIGNTSLVSFSPLGSSTSGSLYVAGLQGAQMAIRIFGGTGRVRVLVFDAQARQWRS